jgi:homoserine kinase
VGVALSGAGPAIIAFADNNFKLIARVMEETFRESGVRVRVMILNPTSVGVRVLEQK